MSFLDVMNAYFQGEKLEALWYILPSGILLVVLGITALKVEQGGFAWGVAVPCFLFGLILLGTGIGVGFRTDSQVAKLERVYAQSPAQLAEIEMPRMEKVNANFRTTFYLFGVIVFFGLGVHYLGGEHWGRAIGAVLILAGGIGLLIDGFAERRAVPYTEALQQISISDSAPPAENSQPPA